MDLQIFLLLGQDGVTSGAIYALLALALVLVFAVTRVIFIPQGEFVAYGALTLASLQANKVPGTVWLLLALGTAVAVIDGVRLLRERRFRKLPPLLIFNIGMPLAGAGALFAVPPAQLPLWAQVIVAMALVVPSADTITPRQHVDVQAAAQKWVDSSISKTANVPTDFPYEQFKDIYLYAYEKGLKGCTTFRPNPVTGAVLIDGDERMPAVHCCSVEREAD